MIDITMTACKRLELIKKTISSFFDNFIGLAAEDLRLIINIDPVGKFDHLSKYIEFLSKYFDNMTLNMPSKYSFPTAFKWVWEQTDAPYILHLEDDWEMAEEVSLHEMLALLKKYDDLMILRLPAFKSTKEHMKNWNKFYPWNGEFFECPENEKGGLAFCGHPSLIKKKFVHFVTPRLDPNRNPEKQIKGRNPAFVNFIPRYRYGVYAKQNSPAVIKDIGRKWMVENGFKKKDSKAFFTEWERC